MSVHVQARRDPIGAPVLELDTPALVVDLDLLERNVERIARHCQERGVGWRPQSKGLRVREVARRCVEAGALGITCAKLGDAEWFADGGLDHILIANEIVGASKLERLLALRERADVMLSVDSPDGLAAAGAAARAAGTELGVVLEVDIGLRRCGVAAGEPAVALGRLVQETRGLRLEGLMAWEGHTLSVSDPEARAPEIRAALELLVETAELCRARGLPIHVVNASGTGTYRVATTVPGITEVQAGGGVYGDRTYARWGVPVDFALTVAATVISRPTPSRVVLDAGQRAMSIATTLPWPKDLPNVASVAVHVEHCIVELSEPSATPRIGDHLELVAGYHDTTVCLHDELYAARGGRVEAVWPVAPRSSFR